MPPHPLIRQPLNHYPLRLLLSQVIGDGAITGGMAYEAMNHAGFLDTNMIVILNDNQQVRSCYARGWGMGVGGWGVEARGGLEMSMIFQS